MKQQTMCRATAQDNVTAPAHDITASDCIIGTKNHFQ